MQRIETGKTMQFKDTYVCLSAQLNFDGSFITYNQWKRKPDESKAAFLFVNFYPEIQYAWYKAGFSYVDECEAVSTALQYLTKNVPKISLDKKRYTKSYIRQVCFNCIRSLHWKKCDIERSKQETSLVFEHDGKECNVLSLVASEEELDYNTPEFENECENIYDYVAKMGIEYENLAYHIANPEISLKRCRKSSSNRDKNPFADVSVSSKDVDLMTKEIKQAVLEYVYNFRPDLISYVAQ